MTVIKSTISDHYALFSELPFTIAKADKTVCYARSVKKLNRDDNLLKLLFLLHFELEKLSVDNSVSFKIQFLTRSIINIFDRFCPSKLVDIKKLSKKTWITKNIKKLCKNRDTAHKKNDYFSQ